MTTRLLLALAAPLALAGAPPAGAQPAARELRVRPTEDFAVTGDGSDAAWAAAAWEPLHKRTAAGQPYETRVKALYSKTGFYTLMDATDRTITATIKDDFENLWTEDVFEVFLWPDERHPVYFEYEISPLNVELPIIVPNLDGRAHGWRPWHYDGARKVRKATSAVGGPLKSGGTVTGWRAEVFIPYELLKPLTNVPPKPGGRWRANFYRMDYDGGQTTSWDWARVGPSFHEFQKFGTLVFE
jgi:Carbohydrate family 9 binding domain-like